MAPKRVNSPTRPTCCSVKRKFRKLTISCYLHPANACLIEPDRRFYLHANETYSVLDTCFNQARKESSDGKIIMYTDQSDPSNTKHVLCDFKDFTPQVNNEEPAEPLIYCESCGSQAHAFCVKVDPKTRYACKTCRPYPSKPGRDSVYRLSSRLLFLCPLGEWIQKKVDSYIAQCSLDNHQNVRSVRVRIVSSKWRKFEVKKWISMTYKSILPHSYRYRRRAIFAFQDQTDGTEICFFALFVDEYDDESAVWSNIDAEDCCNPNSRHVNISYLDSVTYFQPISLRRGLYYRIILSYLEYAGLCGYEQAYIWSCPPNPGDDYIFYAHPPSQERRYPLASKLNQWYINLLDQGIESRIISFYTDISHLAILDGKQIHEFPYFYGDFWPKFMEDTIQSLAQELQDDSGRIVCPDEFNIRLNERATAEFLKHKLTTFCVHLNPRIDSTFQVPVSDFSPTLPCEIVDLRENFLGFCKFPDEKYPKLRCEFSDERRAKFSTHRFLKEILKCQRTYTIACAKLMYHSFDCQSTECRIVDCHRYRKLAKLAQNLPPNHPMAATESSPGDPYFSLAFRLMRHHTVLCQSGCHLCNDMMDLTRDYFVADAK